MKFYLFRHGETDWNAQGRFQGHLDVELNERGRSQARGLIPKLRNAGVETIVSSDLWRARETAEIVAKALDIQVHLDPDLREAHLGDAQGLTVPEIEGRFGAVLGRWKSNLPTDADIGYPGGETGAIVIARAMGALRRIAKAYPLEKVGISTHGGIIRRVMHAILPPESERVPIPNAVLYVVQYEESAGRWSVIDGPKFVTQMEKKRD